MNQRISSLSKKVPIQQNSNNRPPLQEPLDSSPDGMGFPEPSGRGGMIFRRAIPRCDAKKKQVDQVDLTGKIFDVCLLPGNFNDCQMMEIRIK